MDEKLSTERENFTLRRAWSRITRLSISDEILVNKAQNLVILAEIVVKTKTNDFFL